VKVRPSTSDRSGLFSPYFELQLSSSRLMCCIYAFNISQDVPRTWRKNSYLTTQISTYTLRNFINIDAPEGHIGVHLCISYMVVHLIYGRVSHTWACISYMGVHLSISSTGVHLIHGRASLIWACISHIGLHLCISYMVVHLTYGRASHIWACISNMVVHLIYGYVSHSGVNLHTGV
jgi:hypothetical protein